MNPQKQFEERIQRLLAERAYSRPGWHVPVRRVRAQISGQSICLSLMAWLMYPLYHRA